MATVLVVEDHNDTLEMMLKIVGMCGHRGVGALTGEAALAVISSEKPDIIICGWDDAWDERLGVHPPLSSAAGYGHHSDHSSNRRDQRRI